MASVSCGLPSPSRSGVMKANAVAPAKGKPRRGHRSPYQFALPRSSAALKKTSAEKKFETRQCHWSGLFPPGVTVDELVRFRRKRPPGDQPQDNLHPQSGKFSFLKSEYTRRFKVYPRRNSARAKEIAEFLKLKPKDFLKLEGSVLYLPEYKDKFIAFPIERRELWKPVEQIVNYEKNGWEKISEQCAQYVAYIGAEKPALTRRNTTLKQDGAILVNSSEFHDQFIEHPIVARPPLIKRDTSLRLEGDMATNKEKGDTIKNPGKMPPRPDLIRRPSNLKSEGEMALMTEKIAQYVQYATAPRTEILKHPENLHSEGDREFLPEYREQYIDYPRERHVALRHVANLVPEGKMGKETELMAQYKDFPRERHIALRQAAQLKLQGEMSNDTELRSEFKNCPRERCIAVRHEAHLKPEGEMGKETEKTTAYIDFPRERNIAARHEANLKSEGEFEKETELGSKFKDFPRERRIATRHLAHLKPEGRIGKDTEIRTEFRDFPRERNIAPRHEAYLKPEGEIAKDTEIRSEFRDFPRERKIAARHEAHLKPEGEIAKDTEIRTEFRDFPRERKIATRHEAHLKPEGDIASSTESSRYCNFPRERPLLQRTNTNMKTEGDFDGTTENSQYFSCNENTKRPERAKQQDYLHLEGEIEIRPEYNESFVNFPRERPILQRNKSQLKCSEDRINTDPEYKSSFMDSPRERPTFKRPSDQLIKSENGLAGKISEAQRQYKTHEDAVKTELSKRPPTSLKMEGKLDVDPEYTRAYVDHRVHSAQSFKVLEVINQGDLLKTKAVKLEDELKQSVPNRTTPCQTVHADETVTDSSTMTSDPDTLISKRHSPTYRLEVTSADNDNTRSFVVLPDANNNDADTNLTQSRWMKEKRKPEKWTPSWAENAKAKK